MDSDYILRRSSELIELAEQAGLGMVPWLDFNKMLVEIVPGSTSIFLQDSNNPDADSIVQYGFDYELMKTYKAHYEGLNPWNDFWSAAATGRVYRSSAVMPAKSFSESEFYNGWLAQMDRKFDGIGIKLDASSDVSLMLSMQLPDRQLEEAETVLEPLLANVGGALIRAVSTNLKFRTRIQKSVAAAAIVDRSPDMAFAIDQDLAIVEANEQGERSLAVNGVAKAIGNRLNIGFEPVQKWLRIAVQALIGRRPLGQNRIAFRYGGDVFRLSVFKVPEHDISPAFTVLRRYLVLVLVRKISDRSKGPDIHLLATVFGLTPSELKMCEVLLDNLTLAESAERLAITRETARHRLKQIFHKTGTNRQAELMALLMRVG